MKLVSLHIDNFGKFSNFNHDFNNGLNQLNKENGWGKSTLTAFIKVMFYGFDNSARRDSYENEKKRYRPWNGGLYGGNITFTVKDKCYTVYRTFQAKDREDTFRLIDYKTRLESDDYSSNIGYELFRVDSNTFKKTLCIYENCCMTESTGDIEALLGDSASDTDDINKFNQVIQNIDDKLNALSPTRKTGELYRKMEHIGNIEKELKELPVLEESVEQTITFISSKKMELHRLSCVKQELKEKTAAMSQYSDSRSTLLQYDIYYRQMEDKKHDYEDRLKEFGKLPDIKDIKLNMKYCDDALESYSKLKSIELNAAQYRSIKELKEEVSGYSHDEITQQINNIRKLDILKDNLQSKFFKRNENTEHINIAFLIPPISIIIIIVIVCLVVGLNKSINKDLKLLIAVIGVVVAGIGIITHILKLKKYNRQYALTAQWMSYHNIPFDEDAIDTLSMIDNKLYELEQLMLQNHDYNVAYKKSDFSIYLKKVCTFIGNYNNYMTYELSQMLINDNNKKDIILIIKECRSCLYTMMQNIEIIRHIKKEYEDACDVLNKFKNNHNNIEELKYILNEYNPGSSKTDGSQAETQEDNMTVLNKRLDDIIKKIEQCNSDISDYTFRLNTYQDKLDELTDKKAVHAELKEDYEARLKDYDNLRLAKEYLIKARISFSYKYQVPVSDKFNEYIDICNEGVDVHKDYCFDINNRLFKNEYGQERELRFLSSGSKDIAGLCLRLAFINAMYKEEFPFIILDDPFVNMDPDTIKGAKRLISMLSADYQILYFTCHESRLINE